MAEAQARQDNLFAEGAAVDVETAPTPRASTVRALGITKRHMSSSKEVVRLSDLPPYVADALRSLDVDGDGTIDLGELTHGANEADKSVRKRACPRNGYRACSCAARL
jgi:hypothetical protein